MHIYVEQIPPPCSPLIGRKGLDPMMESEEFLNIGQG